MTSVDICSAPDDHHHGFTTRIGEGGICSVTREGGSRVVSEGTESTGVVVGGGTRPK